MMNNCCASEREDFYKNDDLAASANFQLLQTYLCEYEGSFLVFQKLCGDCLVRRIVYKWPFTVHVDTLIKKNTYSEKNIHISEFQKSLICTLKDIYIGIATHYDYANVHSFINPHSPKR